MNPLHRNINAAQVTSLSMSIRLNEAGFSEDSRYQWIRDPETGEWLIRESDFYDLFDGPAYCAGNLNYPAYSFEELQRILPSCLHYTLSFDSETARWIVHYDTIRKTADTREDAVALLILAKKTTLFG